MTLQTVKDVETLDTAFNGIDAVLVEAHRSMKFPEDNLSSFFFFSNRLSLKVRLDIFIPYDKVYLSMWLNLQEK